MDTLPNMEIFDEIISSTELTFSDIFQTLTEFMYPYEKHMRAIIDYNGEDPFIATLCVGLITCLRSFETPYKKKTYFTKLLHQYISNLQTYKYTAKNHDNKPWFSFLKWNKTKLIHIPREVIFARIPDFVSEMRTSHHNYYNTQKAVYNLFNEGLTSTEYHADYNNYQTFIITSFYSTLNNLDEIQQQQIMELFIYNFIEFHLDDVDCVYDNYTTIKSYTF